MESNSNQNNEYVETNFELAQRCQKFLELHHDLTVTRLYNPFTERIIKKGGATYFGVYSQVRRYLQSLDDEEFHSPIKELQIVSYEVPPILDENRSPERYLTDIPTNDTILVDWYKKLEGKLEKLKTQKNQIHTEQRYLNYKYDEAIMTKFNNQEDFEMKKNLWIERNIELYSFLDHYKPEIFKNEYICKQLIVYNYSSKDEFIRWLPRTCETFLMKRYDQPYYTHPNLNQYQRYPTSLIHLWIYQPFILEARKFLKKHKNKIVQYISSKPTHEMKLKKQHFTSLILSFYLMKTNIEELEDVKKGYETYFDKMLIEFFRLSDRDRIYARASYAMILTDFLGNRIKPYRYTQMKYEDLEEFDKIIFNLDNPPVVAQDESNGDEEEE